MLPELIEGEACAPLLHLLLLYSEVLPELVEGEASAPLLHLLLCLLTERFRQPKLVPLLQAGAALPTHNYLYKYLTKNN